MDDLPDGLVAEDSYELSRKQWLEIRQLAENWEVIAQAFPSRVHDQALWKIIGYPLFVGMNYVSTSVYSDIERLDMIRALKHVSLAIPGLHRKDAPMGNGYFMLWDTVAKQCKDGITADACFEVLSELLDNVDDRVRYAALHGLGHLDHPNRAAVVQRFIETNDRPASSEDLAWLEACRDGTVM